ncbi:MAG: ABC transporter transmembrane domain-containing protein, partial [Firmicutes bacterium]|nr:ABC transporter transmembrane domain-containing protein [Bacillota bacterium]
MKKKEKKKQKTMLRLLKYAFKNKLLVAIAFIFSLIANSFAISAPFIIGKAIDLMTEAPVDLSTVLIWCMILLSLYLISALFNFLTHFVSYFIAGKAVYNLRKDMYLKMTKMSVKFFDTTSHGEIMQRMTSDMDYILDGLYQLITQ